MLRARWYRSWWILRCNCRMPWRDCFMVEYNYEAQFPYTPNIRAIRTADLKLIRYPHGDGSPDRFTAELYDLRADPLEMDNLANQPAWRARRKELETRLEELSRAAGRDVMPVYGGITNMLPKH